MPAQVVNNANRQNGEQGNNLADILVNQRALSSERGKSVKLAQIQTGKPQEEIIKEQNLVNEAQLVRAVATLHNIPYVDLDTSPVEPEALAILPQEVAERFTTFPLSVNKSTKELVLAMANPLDLAAIEFIEQKTGMRVKTRAAEPSKVEQLISTHYVTSLTQEVTAALKDVVPDRERLRTLETARTGLIREEKIAEIVRHVLEFAVKARASDVHIEPMEKSTRVRYRIDGILYEKLTMPKELHDALISRIKILSGMKIDEKRMPQDGRFNFKTGSEEVDLRVSTLPATWGEKVVLRLLQKTGGIPDLDELGLRGRGLKNLQDAVLRPHGIILICGPTGSGKTTTLYSIISKISTPKVNIITLEDPIEYKISGVNQVQINPVAGLTFASGLRSLLRQDPDIILVGEIRDKETADLAIQASLTGHLVFSTLHTNDSAGALPRLLDMGVEPYLLASSMTAVAAQRVVRRIHLECKKSYKPDPKIVQNIKNVLGPIMQDDKDFLLYKGEGDPECNNTGYFGRIGIFEVLPISEKIAKLILERAPSSAIEKRAREEGMISLKQDGYLRVIEGITTMDEVLRVAEE
ncbi:type II/IV secretion system protein [Patescibacteria group bacterium]|nr:type II/IV secretion system protein [Patescibacteria group bacterium]